MTTFVSIKVEVRMCCASDRIFKVSSQSDRSSNTQKLDKKLNMLGYEPYFEVEIENV